MKTRYPSKNSNHGFRPLGILLIVPVLAGAPQIASAAMIVINFTQTGYSGGATVTGSFSGTDLNNNGVLSTFESEISSYSMTFSGNSAVPMFSHSTIDLLGLVYKLGTPLLGDDQVPAEGIASGPPLLGPFPPPPFLTYSYVTGYGPTGITTGFGLVQDNNLPLMPLDHTSNYAVIAGVPEPSAFTMVAVGLACAALACRLRCRTPGSAVRVIPDMH